MKNFSLNNILCAAAFSLVAGFSINASAAGQVEETYVQVAPSGVRSVVLQYSKDDLATEEGRIELQHRIAKAARQVCGQPVPGSRVAVSYDRACSRAAEQAAMSQIGSAQIAVIGY